MQKGTTFLLLLNYLKNKSYCTVTIVLLFVIYYAINVNNIRNGYQDNEHFFNIIMELPTTVKTIDRNEKIDKIVEVRYILLWDHYEKSPFNYFKEGQSVFKEKNCSYTNCYITSDRNYLGDYTEFEVVAFNGPFLQDLRSTRNIPKRRSPRQKYVYVNIESAANYPICTNFWDNYFNWTWTYRLDSDVVWKYYVIRNTSKHVIGPSKSTKWMSANEMRPISKEFKNKLKSKKKAAAWFVSNCDTRSVREDMAKQIQEYMHAYDLVLDMYGECGKLSCPKSSMAECLRMLEKYYYFYFAFENAISEDYITEKVLHALNHNTVPVVFGGANYSRFLPPGSYLDARELGPRKLAETMNAIIQKPAAYHSFFKWKKYYSFHSTYEDKNTDVFCQFCAALNNKNLEKTSVYTHLQHWWTPTTLCKDVIVVKIH